MANLIENAEGLSHHAPLSNAQSLAIARHLQDLITQVNNQVQDLRTDHNMVKARVDDLEAKLKATKEEVTGLQDDQTNEHVSSDGLKKDVERFAATLKEVQAGLATSNADTSKLRETQLETTTSVAKLTQQLEETDALTTKLQEALRKCTDVGIVQLRNEISRQELDVQRLLTHSMQSQAGQQEHTESLRSIELSLRGIRDDLADMQTRMAMDEQRLEESNGVLKTTQQDVADVGALATALREDHERTKEHANELRGGLKKVGTRTKAVQEGLGKACKDLQATSSRLESAIQKLDLVDKDLTAVQDHTNRQSQGGEVAHKAILRLENEVRDLRTTTMQVRAGLKETSSLLLPNIHQDSAEARTATARHGSLLATGGMGGFPSPGSAAGGAAFSMTSTAGGYNATRRTPPPTEGALGTLGE